MACNVITGHNCVITAQSIEKWLSSWLIEILHVLHGILVLQGHCFVSRLDCLHLLSNHAKFKLNLIRNG